MVAHDYFTDLKAGVHGNIPDMTFDELRKLDFGSWKGPEYAGEQIPTLEEVLEVAQGFQMIHIELKPYFDRDEEIADPGHRRRPRRGTGRKGRHHGL